MAFVDNFSWAKAWLKKHSTGGGLGVIQKKRLNSHTNVMHTGGCSCGHWEYVDVEKRVRRKKNHAGVPWSAVDKEKDWASAE